MQTTNKSSSGTFWLVCLVALLQLGTFVMIADMYFRSKKSAASAPSTGETLHQPATETAEVVPPSTTPPAHVSEEAPVVTRAPRPTPPAQGQSSQASDSSGSLELVSLDTKVAARGSVSWKYTWIALVRNRTASQLRFRAKVEWTDASGFIIDDDESDVLTIAPNATTTFSGTDEVIAGPAENISSIRGKLELEQ